MIKKHATCAGIKYNHNNWEVNKEKKKKTFGFLIVTFNTLGFEKVMSFVFAMISLKFFPKYVSEKTLLFIDLKTLLCARKEIYFQFIVFSLFNIKHFTHVFEYQED